NGQQISENEFAQATAQVKATAEDLLRQGCLETLPTFFEQVTAIALTAFAQAKIDLAILETGLGGRLDSTTAAAAGIVGITPIAMDHEEYLGQNLAAIAAEKAAIIRPGVDAIVAPQVPEALDVILKQCERSRVKPLLISEEQIKVVGASADGRLSIRFETTNDRYENATLGLRGRH